VAFSRALTDLGARHVVIAPSGRRPTEGRAVRPDPRRGVGLSAPLPLER
jgi:hypothetical protein